MLAGVTDPSVRVGTTQHLRKRTRVPDSDGAQPLLPNNIYIFHELQTSWHTQGIDADHSTSQPV